MKLSLNPLEIPFMVGDTVWVSKFNGDKNQRLDFQARITQIILDGNLTNNIAIMKREELHEWNISSAIYELKPTAEEESPRVTIDISLDSPQTVLFATKDQMIENQTAQLNKGINE